MDGSYSRHSGYFDENATATPLIEAAQAAAAWLSGPPSNPSSVHQLGRRARGAVELSRRQVAESLGVNPRHITFTSSATEALHTLIGGLISPRDHVIVSAVEHSAVWGALRQSKASIDVVPVDSCGRVDPAEFSRRAQPSTKLAVMMAAQNELGVIYPTKEIATALGGVPLLVDAVQAFGKVPLDLNETGAQFSVVSGHKIGAPLGSAAIWSSGGQAFHPLLGGGAQERGRRAGTENVPSIVGFGVAASCITARLTQMQILKELRDKLRERLLRVEGVSQLGAWLDEDQSNGEASWTRHAQLPNTLYIQMARHEGDLILQHLDLQGFCLSTGAACSSGALEPSPVLLALGLKEEEAKRGLRISMGPEKTHEDIDQLIDVLLPLIS